MKVSLNWIKKYVDIPDSISPKQIAYDLSLRTVEVESVEYVNKKYSEMDCKINIEEDFVLDDIVLEIDNKSLTNRPDLWGHYGIAREIATIYDLKLKELPKVEIDKNLPKYQVEIKEHKKCRRYVGIEIENVSVKESPKWMKALIINAGMRPINAIVDITNYVMMAVGQPMHAFDRTHIDGKKIIVRNAKKDEKLILLDDNQVELSEEDLVISDENDAIALAGIRGGKKDSILEDTTGFLLEIANFTAETIRKTGRRFDEKTDSSIRYEKNIDTERVDLGISMALRLIKEIYPESKIVSWGEEYPVKTERAKIDVKKEFLDVRLGKILPIEQIEKILKALGYDVEYKENILKITAPVWRSTGDVSLRDDVMGDIARILGYQSFKPKPLPIKIEKAVIQNNVLLERRIKEYLANRCGFNEIYTYPWIDTKYINAAGIDLNTLVKLATPPAPKLAHLRKSLIPGMLEAISKNLRYLDSFKMFEMAQVFEKGEYHESTEEEILPIHKKYLAGCIVGKDPKELFYEIKGIIENMAMYCHMEDISLEKRQKASWVDINGYLNIIYKNQIIGNIGLLSVVTMANSKIRRVNVAAFELNVDMLVPLDSRSNKYNKLPLYPLVEKDLSIIVDEKTTWHEIDETIRSKVKELEFIEEYKGSQIENGKKSIMLRVKLGNDDSTMTSEQTNVVMQDIIHELNYKCGAELRVE